MLDTAIGIGEFQKEELLKYMDQNHLENNLTLHIVAESQKAGGSAAFIDVEHALDPLYAKNIGVDTDNLLISQPIMVSKLLNGEALVKSYQLDVIVVDSVAALVPKAELEGL